MKAEYPKWLYHETEKPRIVGNPEEQEALEGWHESPAEVGKPKPKGKKKTKE